MTFRVAVWRKDVARGARLSVQTVPTVVMTRKSDGRQSIAAGAQAYSAYQQALEGLRAAGR
ncbi:MAG: hypothetical protein AMXMBFR7_30250 [Planctomycetota bacterium]